MIATIAAMAATAYASPASQWPHVVIALAASSQTSCWWWRSRREKTRTSSEISVSSVAPSPRASAILTHDATGSTHGDADAATSTPSLERTVALPLAPPSTTASSRAVSKTRDADSSAAETPAAGPASVDERSSICAPMPPSLSGRSRYYFHWQVRVYVRQWFRREKRYTAD
ncbi:hypothetical protein M885DRAFT_540253 [Pelagophyceae sp. CCMP2097]|nr:hypothetical protein M885DRAFT_540253 [Pelagophyceae sp. CCMP2097]